MICRPGKAALAPTTRSGATSGTPWPATSLIIDSTRRTNSSHHAGRSSESRRGGRGEEYHGVRETRLTRTQISAIGRAASRVGGMASAAGIAATIRSSRLPGTSWCFRSSSTNRESSRWTGAPIFLRVHAPVDGGLPGALGRQHAGCGDHEFRPEDELPRIARHVTFDGTLHAR